MTTTKKTVGALLVAVGLAMTTGCATSGMTESKPAPCSGAQALDGRSFAVALVAERGGVSERVDLAFARGMLEASDARAEGYAPALYVVRSVDQTTAIEFEAETRGPSGRRRFNGRIIGDQIEGTLMVSNDGTPPARFTFGGHVSM